MCATFRWELWNVMAMRTSIVRLTARSGMAGVD